MMELSIQAINYLNYSINSTNSRYESSSLVSENSDLLNCEYTIHPQWLLDKPSANPDNWYNDSNIKTDLQHEKSQLENEPMGHLSTENCITDESGWTEKEKNLLERGIEIFGKSNLRLSQFIGSKTSSEVRYYLKNFYSESYPKIDTSEIVNEADVLSEKQVTESS